MNDAELKRIEYEVQNLMKYRDNCINVIVLTAGGAFGLLVTAFSYLKLVLFAAGLLLVCFLIILTNMLDEDIDLKIKEFK